MLRVQHPLLNTKVSVSTVVLPTNIEINSSLFSLAIEGKMEGKSCTCYCPSNSESNSRSSGCFASDTLVTLINHQKIPIRQLRPTDELLTSDGKAVLTTEMMMMLDKNAVVQSMLTYFSATHHNAIRSSLLFSSIPYSCDRIWSQSQSHRTASNSNRSTRWLSQLYSGQRCESG